MEKKFIYHYTTVDACVSILKNKNLWLTNAKNLRKKREDKLTDEKECLLFQEDLKNSLSKKYGNDRIKGVFDDMSKFKNSDPYLVSFCSKYDLNDMWNTYANNHTGVCLVFDFGNLKKLYCERDMSNYRDPMLICGEVAYDWDITEHDLYKELVSYLETGKFITFSGLKSVQNNIDCCATIKKQPQFSGEYEYRFSTIPFAEKLYKKYKEGNHVKMPLENNYIKIEDVLCKIVLGKDCQDEQKIKDIICSLSYNKLYNNIVKEQTNEQ